MIVVDSDALGMVTKSLGLTGRGAAMTEFLDSTVDQVFDVVPAIRRGRTAAGTEGLFTGTLQNEHAGASSLVVAIDPYAPAANGFAPYPSPVPGQFDVWLLSAIVIRTTGSGTLSGVLDVQYNVQGWGRNNDGTSVTVQHTQPLAFWDAVATEGQTFGILNGTRGPYVKLGIRIPRIGSPVLAFRSTSSAIASYACQVVLGLFPVSLGQDALV